MVGLAGIMAAVAVISAGHAAPPAPAGRPAVHASASPSATQPSRPPLSRS
jgi:hypothetical protein